MRIALNGGTCVLQHVCMLGRTAACYSLPGPVSVPGLTEMIYGLYLFGGFGPDLVWSLCCTARQLDERQAKRSTSPSYNARGDVQ